MKSHLSFRNKPSGQRGSVLIVALILTSIIGAILLPSYLTLSRSSLELSHRGFTANNANNLAESGIEYAMWALTQDIENNESAWDGWTLSGSDAKRRIDGFDFGSGITGAVNIFITNYDSENPNVIAKATVSTASGRTTDKWVRANLTRQGNTGTEGSEEEVETRSPGGLFAYGLLARDTIRAVGGTWIDSWISDHDDDPATPPIPWSQSVRRGNARVASVSSDPKAVQLSGSAAIYGTVALGAATEAVNGSNHPLTPAPWSTKIGPLNWNPSGSGLSRIAQGALLTGFTASFETITPPTNTVQTASVSYPKNNPYVQNGSIGQTGTTQILEMNKLTVEGASTLTVRGHVVLVLPPSSTETVKIAGSGRVLLEEGASLAIYTPGNINVSGAGIVNPAASQNLQIWGTAPEGSNQTISLAGSGLLSAVVYAPNAVFNLPGHTDFSGSAVVKSANLTGSGSFHYDESLTSYMGTISDSDGSGGSDGSEGLPGTPGKIGIIFYTELEAPAQREAYLADLNF